MSNRAGTFVTLLQNHEGFQSWFTDWQEQCETLVRNQSDRDYSTTGCVKTLSSTAPLSVYTLMFSYFTASDIFMEENLFILGTKLDLIINKLSRNNKLIITIPAQSSLVVYIVFYFKSEDDCDCFFCWRIIYLV